MNAATPEVTEIDASEPKSFRQRVTGAAVAMFGASVMYVLMSGPLAFLHNKVAVGPFRTAIETMFAPVVFIVKNDIEPLSTIMKAYIGLFT